MVRRAWVLERCEVQRCDPNYYILKMGCLSLLWLCKFWNVHGFGNGVLSVDCVNGCYVVRVEEPWLFSRRQSPNCVKRSGWAVRG